MKGENSMNNYNFGDMLLIDYGKGETYRAMVFGNSIGYEDGEQDKLSTVLEQASNGICKVTIIK